MLFDFAKRRRLRITGSWFQMPDCTAGLGISIAVVQGKRPTMYSWAAAGDFSRTAGIFGALRLSETTTDVKNLKIRPKSRKKAPSKQVQPYVHRLQNESVAQEFERELAKNLGEPNDSDDPEKFCTDSKTKILKVSEKCEQGTLETFKSFLTKETLNIIAESRMARLETGRKTGQ